MIIENIVLEFESHQNSVNAAKMAAYMKDHFKFYGIKSPLRKEIQKKYLQEFKAINFQEALIIARELFEQPHRELHYFALDLIRAKKKLLSQKHVKFAEHLVLNNSWWDSVDFIAVHIYCPVLMDMNNSKRNEYIDFLKNHENMWMNRVGIIFQLPLKDKTDTNLLEIAIFPHMNSKEFFHQKAIGWALRQYSKTNPSYVEDFIRKNNLSNLAKREASKYL